MVPGRTATFAASVAVAVAVGGISVWEIARPEAGPELLSPSSTAVAPLAARKVASVAPRKAGLAQRPEPPEMRRIVQRMIFR